MSSKKVTTAEEIYSEMNRKRDIMNTVYLKGNTQLALRYSKEIDELHNQYSRLDK